MAKPQVEEGYVKIANELLEAIMRAPLTQYEWRSLMCIMRYTYGWNRKEAHISYTAFRDATGIHPKHVVRSVQSLISKRVITSRKDAKGRIYAIQKDYDKWLFPNQGIPSLGNKVFPNQGIEVFPNEGIATPSKPSTDKGQREPKDSIKDIKDNLSLTPSLRERLFEKMKTFFPSLSSIPESIPTKHIDFLVYTIGKGDVRPDMIHHPIAYLKKLSIGEAFPSFLERETKDKQRKEKTKADKEREKEEERAALESRDSQKRKVREIINGLGRKSVCQTFTPSSMNIRVN